MTELLTLAVPSKGRLRERTLAILESAGYAVTASPDERRYRADIAGRPDIEVVFYSAAEIARELALGRVHLGITGEDLVRESVRDAADQVALILPLDFGHADVVIAVPEVWIDVWSMEDLDDVAAGFRSRHGRRLRIATKYWNLTQDFFASHGVALYRIVESLGATEGAPVSGAAEAIVDITSSGATLRANGLKILHDGLIVRSQANLVMSRRACWDARRLDETRAIVAAVAGAIGSQPLPKEAIFAALKGDAP